MAMRRAANTLELLLRQYHRLWETELEAAKVFGPSSKHRIGKLLLGYLTKASDSQIHLGEQNTANALID